MPFEINWSAAVIGALLGLAAMLVFSTAVLLVLRALGFRILWRRRSRSPRAGTVTLKQNPIHDDGEELPEEELILILTAAVAATPDTSDESRFRVVAFRRI